MGLTNNAAAAGHIPAATSETWNIRREDVAKAIETSKDTMPGPDRIPYIAWRRLGDSALNVLYESAQALSLDDGVQLLVDAAGLDTEEGQRDFNWGVLCCLPKKAVGTHPTHGEYFTPENTRPLSIVNTDNRIIASACRIRWEPIFNEWVSTAQRGFLRGRSMLSNVIDIDFEAMRVSLTCEQGASVLFDMKAAFPSLAHEYLFKVLRHMGLPRTVLNIITALYNQNKCVISCGGHVCPGFQMRAGIRQGCPLSPLLFAVTVDMLLRRLAGTFPMDVVRAFADDTAMVVSDWWKSAGAIRQLFHHFG